MVVRKNVLKTIKVLVIRTILNKLLKYKGILIEFGYVEVEKKIVKNANDVLLKFCSSGKNFYSELVALIILF